MRNAASSFLKLLLKGANATDISRCNIEGELPDSRAGTDPSLHNTEISDFYFGACNNSRVIVEGEPVIFLRVCAASAGSKLPVSRRHVTQPGARFALWRYDGCRAWRLSTADRRSSTPTIDLALTILSREFLRPIKTDAIARCSMTLSRERPGLFETQRPRSSSFLILHSTINIGLIFLLKLFVAPQLSRRHKKNWLF